MNTFAFENKPDWYRRKNIHKRTLRTLLHQLFKDYGFHVKHVSFILLSDEALLQINRKYLNHDYYTDVITFNLSENQEFIVGEVYMSMDTIKTNAARFNCSVKDEFLRVTIHSCLHLCGLDDHNELEQQEMRAKEDHYIKKFYDIDTEKQEDEP
jgi:probable rRNA maturation factor